MKSRLLLVCLLLLPLFSEAKLLVEVGKSRQTSKNVVVSVTMKNIFTQAIDGARATLILMDESGKSVAQLTQNVIGTTRCPTLKPGRSEIVSFVFPKDVVFKKAKVVFAKVVLDGGKTVDPEKDVEIVHP
jgi:SLAP domain-containing protein